MPQTIPYHPALVLGSIVDLEILDNLLSQGKEMAVITAAKEKLNSLIEMKRSLEMTFEELVNMGIYSDELRENIDKLEEKLGAAAAEYASTSITQLDKIQGIKTNMSMVGANIESPLNYNKSLIKDDMPLAADSLTMDCQYFSHDGNQQDSDSSTSKIAAHISSSVSFLGTEAQAKATTASTTAVSKQKEQHKIDGTLIITATCTHKNAVLLAPLILDIDKAIRAWNQVHPDSKLNTLDSNSIMNAISSASDKDEKDMKIISGITRGSCFIGMAHILNVSKTQSSQEMESKMASAAASVKTNLWFAGKVGGGFGGSDSSASDVKSLLSSQDVTAHANIISMGAFPSIKSNTLMMGVKEYAKFDPEEMMNKLAVLSSDTQETANKMDTGSDGVRTGNNMMSLEGSQAGNSMTALADIAKAENKVIDTNSLMTAFEDYLDKCVGGEVGIPINYYLKPITKVQLAAMWVAKYYPDASDLKPAGDDSADA